MGHHLKYDPVVKFYTHRKRSLLSLPHLVGVSMKFILATADWAFKSSTVDSTWFVPRNQLSITWSEKTRSANNLAPLGQNKLPSSGQFESIFLSLDRLTGHIKLIVMAIKLDFMGDTHWLAKSPTNRGQRECLSNIFWMNYKFLLTMWWCDKRQETRSGSPSSACLPHLPWKDTRAITSNIFSAAADHHHHITITCRAAGVIGNHRRAPSA